MKLEVEFKELFGRLNINSWNSSKFFFIDGYVKFFVKVKNVFDLLFDSELKDDKFNLKSL